MDIVTPALLHCFTLSSINVVDGGITIPDGRVDLVSGVFRKSENGVPIADAFLYRSQFEMFTTGLVSVDMCGHKVHGE